MKYRHLLLAALLVSSVTAQTYSDYPEIGASPADEDVVPIERASPKTTMKWSIASQKAFWDARYAPIGGGGGFDPTAVNTVTWGNGTNASFEWTFDVTGTDPVLTFANDVFSFGNSIDLESNNIIGVDTVTVTTTNATTLVLAGTTVTASGAELNNTAGTTGPIQSQINSKVASVTAADPGSVQVYNMIALTQAQYDASTKDGNTFYIITDAP